jgi:hypothetical protein
VNPFKRNLCCLCPAFPLSSDFTRNLILLNLQIKEHGALARFDLKRQFAAFNLSILNWPLLAFIGSCATRERVAFLLQNEIGGLDWLSPSEFWSCKLPDHFPETSAAPTATAESNRLETITITLEITVLIVSSL